MLSFAILLTIPLLIVCEDPFSASRYRCSCKPENGNGKSLSATFTITEDIAVASSITSAAATDDGRVIHKVVAAVSQEKTELADGDNEIGLRSEDITSTGGNDNSETAVMSNTEEDEDAVLTRGCGRQVISPTHVTRIVGGVEARPNSWPWAVNLEYRESNSGPWMHVCGATIISSRWLLTAAHCVIYDRDPSEPISRYLRAVVGQHQLYVGAEGVLAYWIEKAIHHELFGSNEAGYDIALLQLWTSISFNDHVSPICLPDSETTDFADLVAAGWGRTQGTGDENRLNQVIVPVIPNSACALFPTYRERIRSDMMCAGYAQGGKDACAGDSGGPIMRQDTFEGPWKLAGITSWGIGCAESQKPGVYTRVFRYLSWIKAKTGLEL